MPELVKEAIILDYVKDSESQDWSDNVNHQSIYNTWLEYRERLLSTNKGTRI